MPEARGREGGREGEKKRTGEVITDRFTTECGVLMSRKMGTLYRETNVIAVVIDLEP